MNIRTMVMVLAILSSTAFAASNWLGNASIVDQFKGSTSYEAADASHDLNLCYYDRYSLQFEYYQAGVTDIGQDDTVWQKLNAVATYIQDDNTTITKSMPLQIIGNRGNNVVYSVDLNSIGPSTVANIPPEMQNRGQLKAHIEIKINDQVQASFPVSYVCAD